MSSDPPSPRGDLDVLLEQAAQFDWSEPSQAEPDVQATQNMLVFPVGSHVYAIDAHEIVEVVGTRKITPLPGAPRYVPGVFVYHREVVALLDLGVWFGHQKEALAHGVTSSRVAVVRSQDMVVGFDVGEDAHLVERVQQGEPGLMESLDPKVAHVTRDIYASAQGLVVVLDVGRLCQTAAPESGRSEGV